ncbi:hypothetical protein [Pseudomonas sp. nanlin1]|uniref:hypothetical protein n=1 Tax=Pseudomonas sp. nanlin1 TaxID=3040605 RepID=UPI0038910977
MKYAWLITSALLMAACSSAPSTPSKPNAQDASPFYGRWQVAGVAVSNSGIQALTDNDPSLMGQRLSVSEALLAWEQPVVTGDTCSKPRFIQTAALPSLEQQERLAKLGMQPAIAYAVACQSGDWGPEGQGSPTFFLTSRGELGLSWYDGGMLKLTRSK